MIFFPEYTTYSRYHGDESLVVDSNEINIKIDEKYDELVESAKEEGGVSGFIKRMYLFVGENYYKEQIYREYCSKYFNTADYERALKMEEYFTKLKINRQLLDPMYKKGIVYIVSFFISLAIFLLFIDNIGILDKIANSGFNKYHDNFISTKVLEDKNRELEEQVLDLKGKIQHMEAENLVMEYEIINSEPESGNITKYNTKSLGIALGKGVKLQEKKVVKNTNAKKQEQKKATVNNTDKKTKQVAKATNYNKMIVTALNRNNSPIDKNVFVALIDTMSKGNAKHRDGVSYGVTAMPLFVAKDIWYTIYPNDIYNPKYLYRPDVNIELSVHYISSLTKALDGDLEKALAIYVGYSGDTKRIMKQIDTYLKTNTGKSLNYYNELSIKQHNTRKLE